MGVSNFVFYLLIAIAILYGNVQSQEGADASCESFSTNQTECCKQTNCTFIQCVEANTTANHTGCHQQDWDSTGTCKEDTLKKLCNAATTTTAASTPKAETTAAPNPCESLDETTCCTNDQCQYVTCNSTDTTKTEPYKGCALKTDTLDAECVPNSIKDTCEEPITTPAPASTTTSNSSKTSSQAPGSTTQAPGVDPCLAFTGNATDCCGQATLMCMYVVCEGIDKSPHLGCHVNTTDLSSDCTENTVHNICKTDEWVPNDTPSSGMEKLGQHFDGASFIGGIVLCMGIVVIIFCGQKVYKARAEKNYHTL